MPKKKSTHKKAPAKKAAPKIKPQPLVCFRKTIVAGEIYEIGDFLPKGVTPDRNFAPADIAGNMRARRQWFLNK